MSAGCGHAYLVPRTKRTRPDEQASNEDEDAEDAEDADIPDRAKTGRKAARGKKRRV